MRKLIQSHKGRKKMHFFIASALILSMLAITPAAAYDSSVHFSSSDNVHASAQICSYTLEVVGLELTFASNENFDPLKYIGEKIDIAYMLAGVGAAILLAFIYTRLIKGENELITNEFIKNIRKTLYTLKIRKSTGNKERVKEEVAQELSVKEEITTKQLRLYIAIPVLYIVIAELLIFFGRIEIAVWVHIGVLLTLSLSNIFLKNPKIHKIYMPLMLLSVLRIVNLSMPIFSKTLYTFIFYYIPLAIPVAAIIVHQRNSFEEIGITKKHLLIYIVLAVPLSFLLGLGEYMVIRPGYLIPDLSFENLLMLIIIMVLCVGLVEELIFRSILQSRLEQALSIPEALLITSLLFGLMHSGYGNYYEILYTSFVGLVIGLIYYKTRSLPFVAVLHGCINVFLYGILPLHLIGWAWF